MTASVVTAPGASSRERAYLQALVEHADPLGLGGVAPELEERRGLELRELAGGALAGLLRRLAGLRRRLSGADPVLAVDERELDIAIQLLHVAREEDDHRDRLERLPALAVQVLAHQVGGRRLAGIRLRRAAEALAVAREDAQLEADGVGHLGEQRDVEA